MIKLAYKFSTHRLLKKLYLIRHAKSSWDDLSLSDFDRPLNDRGEKDAPKMGKRLKERRVSPDIMISSPAVRAMETCRHIAKVLNFPSEKIRYEKSLYHADEDQLFSVVKNLPDFPDDEEIVLLFGHNPGITEFANVLFNLRIDNIPTCGVVAGELAVTNWKDVKPGCGKMELFDFPKN